MSLSTAPRPSDSPHASESPRPSESPHPSESPDLSESPRPSESPGRSPSFGPADATSPPPTGPAVAPDRPAPSGAGTPALTRVLLGRARELLADVAPRSGYQRAMYAAGVLLLVSGVVHVGVWAVDGGAWEGAVSWRKPILFGVSFGLFMLSVGWVQGVLPRSTGWGWTTTALTAVGGVAEVGLITAQQWRGTASHFNVAGDPVDATVFVLMGVTIAVFGTGVVALAAWAALRLRRPAPTVIAVGVGLALILVGSALGGDLMTRGMAYVEANDAVPAAVVIGAAGSGKAAHAVALHGLQVLAVLALLLHRSGLAPGARTRAMTTAAAGYVGLTVLVAAQAYAGRSLLEISPVVGAAIGCTALAVIVPFWLALRDAVRR